MKHLALLAAAVVTAVAVAAAVSVLAPAAEPAQAPDVLIVQAAGTPTDVKVTAANVDAVTMPTPTGRNVKTLADDLAAALRAKGLTVRVATPDEVTGRQEVLAPRCVVLGSPAYFGNMSWKLKKLFDTVFWRIHALPGERLAQKPFATYVLGTSEPRCRETAASIDAIVKTCNGLPAATMIVLGSQKPDEVKASLARFADEIAAKAGQGT